MLYVHMIKVDLWFQSLYLSGYYSFGRFGPIMRQLFSRTVKSILHLFSCGRVDTREVTCIAWHLIYCINIELIQLKLIWWFRQRNGKFLIVLLSTYEYCFKNVLSSIFTLTGLYAHPVFLNKIQVHRRPRVLKTRRDWDPLRALML